MTSVVPEAARPRAVTRSASSHPAEWGRAISLALDHLAVQAAFLARKPESGILIGQDVRLSFRTNDDDGVVIEASLEPDVANAVVRPTVPVIPDDGLVARIDAALEACEGIDTSGVDVLLVAGGVILRGSLLSTADRNRLVLAALRVAGVTSIGDELDVPQPHHADQGWRRDAP